VSTIEDHERLACDCEQRKTETGQARESAHLVMDLQLEGDDQQCQEDGNIRRDE
jgi:hypothetical protein